MHILETIYRLIADRIGRIHPTMFEWFVGELMTRLGWQFEVTPQSGDGGVDVIATRQEFDGLQPWTLFIQARRITTETFGAGDVDDCVNTIRRNYDSEEFDRIIIVTTAEATAQAGITAAKYSQVTIWDRDTLVKHILETHAVDLIPEYIEKTE